MYVIKTYTNTECELNVAKARLNKLLDDKEKLYCKYFPVTAKIKDIVITGGTHNNDKMADYVHELYDVDKGTGYSLAEEIEIQQKVVDKLKECLTNMQDALSKMQGIEYTLFYAIVVKGINITKAVEKTAEEYDKDVQTIWKYHYPKIKNYIKKLIRIVNVQ